MIKWLICMLWGHDIDKDVSDLNAELGLFEFPNILWGQEIFYCKRCQKYKRIS